MLQGELTLRIGDEERTLGPRETWCIAPNVVHSGHAGLRGRGRDRRLLPAARATGTSRAKYFAAICSIVPLVRTVFEPSTSVMPLMPTADSISPPLGSQ